MTPRCYWALALLLPLANGAHAEPSEAPSERPKSAQDKSASETPALPYVTLMLARDSAVHNELHLNREQIQQVEAAVAEVDQPMWVLRDVPVPQCREKLDALLAQLRHQLDGVLSSRQIERLDEVILQARGFKALSSGEIAGRLKLSSEQIAQIQAIVERFTGPSSNSAKSDGKNDAAEPVESATEPKPPAKQVLAVLSAEQSSRLAEMVGKPFELSRVRKIGCVAPEIRGIEAWINSDPLTLESSRGKVVAVHFWAFNCINCVHNLPHYKSWYEKFPKSELTIIGVHTPETQSERSVENLRKSVRERGIDYPVAFDAASENWKAWGNHMWPSVYLIDKQGRVRYWWYGELNWQGARGEEFMRKKIDELLAEK